MEKYIYVQLVHIEKINETVVSRKLIKDTTVREIPYWIYTSVQLSRANSLASARWFLSAGVS